MIAYVNFICCSIPDLLESNIFHVFNDYLKKIIIKIHVRKISVLPVD